MLVAYPAHGRDGVLVAENASLAGYREVRVDIDWMCEEIKKPTSLRKSDLLRSSCSGFDFERDGIGLKRAGAQKFDVNACGAGDWISYDF